MYPAGEAVPALRCGAAADTEVTEAESRCRMGGALVAT